MRTWKISELDVQPHQPEVLDSEDEGRAIVIELPAGEASTEHQVHERAWLLVVSGAIEVWTGGESVSGGPGCSPSSTPTSGARCARPRTPACCSCSRPGPARATPASARAFCAFVLRIY